jgi:putative transcriptional regulator
MIRISALMFTIALLASCNVATSTRPIQPQTEWFLMEAQTNGPGDLTRGTKVLVHQSEKGTIGWMIGRPFTGNPRPGTTDIPLWEGGPVEKERLTFIYLDRDNGTIHFSKDMGIMFRIARLPAERNNIRVFVGYCGWAPHQLEGEFAKNMWAASAGQIDAIVFGSE